LFLPELQALEIVSFLMELFNFKCIFK